MTVVISEHFEGPLPNLLRTRCFRTYRERCSDYAIFPQNTLLCPLGGLQFELPSNTYNSRLFHSRVANNLWTR